MAAEWEYKGIQTDSIDPCYFTDPGANNIKVRGPDYLKDRKKVSSLQAPLSEGCRCWCAQAVSSSKTADMAKTVMVTVDICIPVLSRLSQSTVSATDGSRGHDRGGLQSNAGCLLWVTAMLAHSDCCSCLQAGAALAALE